MTELSNGNNGGRFRGMSDWLPVLGIAVAGLVGWGAINNGVSELQRRVAAVELSLSQRQGEDTRIAVQLSALDANMTALRSQVADIADQLRGRPAR